MPKLALLGAYLARFWEHLGDCFLYLGRDLAKMGETQQKTTRVLHFGRFFFGILGVLWEAMLAHLSAMLGYAGLCERQLGATWR